MSKKKEVIFEDITLGKLVHGGQCLAETPNGKKLFVWGGLPGEVIDVRITKKKSGYREGVVTQVRTASKDRIEPIEPLSYLSTSPWQIMTFGSENSAKQAILEETFEREGAQDISWGNFEFTDQQVGYRNKQEFGFWGNDEGLHLAHFVRGSHGKQIVEKSDLAKDCINQAARDVRDELKRLEVWGGKLKTIVLRCDIKENTVAALFIKEDIEELEDFKLPASLKGLDIYYSNPKSPASVATKKLYSYGDIKLSDTISGKNIMYDVLSFFQVNIPVFVNALQVIKKQVDSKSSIDMYSGVGAIGVSIGSKLLVESDEQNIDYAKSNTIGTDTKVIHAASEDALDYIKRGDSIIVDPPRAGLHKAVIDRILDELPSKVIYLSCNPSTQARDVKLLKDHYSITHAQGFNFFPRTPHIESLIVLELMK